MAMDMPIDHLAELAPLIEEPALQQLWVAILHTFDEFEINTPERQAAFMAQILHETGGLRWLEEIWGPTPAQRRYDPPSTLARRLGNIYPGDGFKFRGRGLIQITGRFNYAEASKALGVDLIDNPDLAVEPELAARIAGWYWKSRNLNKLADMDSLISFRRITKAINGGYNGLASRRKFYFKTRELFGLNSKEVATRK